MDNFYTNQLYPLQDQVLTEIQSVDTAREEPKDLADVWGLCTRSNLSLQAAITGAQSKAAGIFPADLARVLLSVSKSDWEVIRWVKDPDPEDYIRELGRLGEQLLLG